MTVERQLRWNVESEDRTEDYPPRQHFRFLIINDERYINRIRQRLVIELQPVETVEELTRGKIPGTDLEYEAFSLDSYRGSPSDINWKKIYDKRKQIIHDENLTKRQGPNGLGNYIDNLIVRLSQT